MQALRKGASLNKSGLIDAIAKHADISRLPPDGRSTRR